MPLDYGTFQIAAPPRTGLGYVWQRLEWAGYRRRDGAWPYMPCNGSGAAYHLGLVRHPCDLLSSLYATRHRIWSPWVPTSATWLCEMPRNVAFDAYVWCYLEHFSGCISRMYESYPSDSVMRIEDMPWAVINQIELISGKTVPERIQPDLRVNASTSVPKWDTVLKQRVIDAETETMHKYEYW